MNVFDKAVNIILLSLYPWQCAFLRLYVMQREELCRTLALHAKVQWLSQEKAELAAFLMERYFIWKNC